MDVDLQDPPELIGRCMVDAGARATTWSTACAPQRACDSLAKRLTAPGFYRAVQLRCRRADPEHAGDFRLLDRAVVEVLKPLPERNRFMKGLFAWVGFRGRRALRAAAARRRLEQIQSVAIVELRPGWRCLLLDRALRAWFYVGVVIAAISVLYALFIITRVLIFGIDTPGYASLLIAVLLMGAIQLLSLGIIGEYLGRLFLEVKGRPIYVVEGVYEDGDSQAPKS